jgi:hypothetical protein
MRSAFILFVLFFSTHFTGWEQNNIAREGSAIPNDSLVTRVDGDPRGAIRIINGSSLKQLPAVVRDLSVAFEGSIFRDGFLLDKNGFAVYLYDMTCNSVVNSAAVTYKPGDTIYKLQLNTLNHDAADNALAATIIHELMHCVLLDIYKRAKNEDEKALAVIIGFGPNGKDTTGFLRDDFFRRVNSGDEGQHELIYRLFYKQMVSILKRFAEIHKEGFLGYKGAESLMWSGLQETEAYKKLSDEDKREIGSTILEAKGINIEEY